MGLKIACLGAAPSSRLLAPFNNPDWEIWVCSPPNYNLPRADAWFELHSIERKFTIAENQPWVHVLQNHPRVYIAAPDARLPNGILYPRDEMVKEFGPYFWSSSLSYMLAMAIMQKPQTIGLWGVDMSAHEEYNFQRPGCHFFIWEAKKRGIEVYAPPQSDILEHHPFYGYKEQTRMWDELKGLRTSLETQKREDNRFRDALGRWLVDLFAAWGHTPQMPWPRAGDLEVLKSVLPERT